MISVWIFPLSKLHTLLLRNNSVVYINNKRFKKDAWIFLSYVVSAVKKKSVNWTVRKDNIFLVRGARSPSLK